MTEYWVCFAHKVISSLIRKFYVQIVESTDFFFCPPHAISWKMHSMIFPDS